MTSVARAASYDIDDPTKIQGREAVSLEDRSLAALRLRLALSAIPDTTGTILMPGAGAGRYARAVAKYRSGWHVVAGDLSAVAIREAIALGGGPNYRVFDAEVPPFPDEMFDAVLFFDLLEHVPNPKRMLKSCHRVLRPGGVLHFFVPLENQAGTLYRLLNNDRIIPIHRWKQDHVGHIQRFQALDIFQLTWDVGFVVSDIAYSFHLTGQLHDFIDYWNRDRSSGGSGWLSPGAVKFASRLAMIATWRLAYLEDSIYSGSLFASGLHVTASRSAQSEC